MHAHAHNQTSAWTQACESWDALLSPALPPLQEPSAPSSAPHAVFRSHSESHTESIWVWCHRLQCSFYACHLYECGSDRGKSGFSWVSEGAGQQTTWIRLRKCVSCFRTLIVPPDTFFCVILYLVLAWRVWGGGVELLCFVSTMFLGMNTAGMCLQSICFTRGFD